MQNSAKHLIVVTGATASGKTSLAIKLAQLYKTEIISADSRQFYKQMPIGTAQPTVEELAEAKHHFIAHLNPDEYFSAGEFERSALQLLDTLFQKHNVVICVGGSGLYIKALCEGFDEIPEVNESYRSKLNFEFEELGLEPLLKELQDKDPEYFNSVDQHNSQRIIRALEVIRATNKTYSSFRAGKKVTRPFNITKIGIEWEREELYKRINQRVNIMLEQGLENEVKALIPHRNLNSLKTVGYRELFEYFDGNCSLETAIEEIKKNTRRFAKKQNTWFKREKDMIWLNAKELDSIQLLSVLNIY
jgi:tRNA dimethylallyltransferase